MFGHCRGSCGLFVQLLNDISVGSSGRCWLIQGRANLLHRASFFRGGFLFYLHGTVFGLSDLIGKKMTTRRCLVRQWIVQATSVTSNGGLTKGQSGAGALGAHTIDPKETRQQVFQPPPRTPCVKTTFISRTIIITINGDECSSRGLGGPAAALDCNSAGRSHCLLLPFTSHCQHLLVGLLASCRLRKALNWKTYLKPHPHWFDNSC